MRIKMKPRLLPFLFLLSFTVSGILPLPSSPSSSSSSSTADPIATPSSSSSSSFASSSSVTGTSNCTARILIPHRYPLTKGKAPPDTMPSELEWAYTRCGRIPIGKYYVDDTLNGEGIHIQFSQKEINKYIDSAQQLLNQVKNNPRNSLGKRGWLPMAFSRYVDYLRGNRAIVFGSMSPLVETLLLAVGVQNITTVEYNKLTYHHPSIRTITPDQLMKEFTDEASSSCGTSNDDDNDPRYDIAVSISSFDHDGLGRYGDPLSPDGDLLSNDEIKNIYLKPKGIYFLTIPIGPDIVVWNLHRRYGNLRLPLLLDGWTILDRVGWTTDTLLTVDVPFTQTTEPVFVLQSPEDPEARNMCRASKNKSIQEEQPKKEEL